ncbi:AraC family transcriptional regulator [Gordonibacter sp. 28C]|uniref:helix-turn-helix transcriptional regulator n=1 Tax=Gordonibacter sp. 28C TaxID=2078569 RepID=UPI001313F42C|nr:AraC family transcriptional regulator [Gordonibacter sp. 28C]
MDAREVRAFARPDGSLVEVCSLAGNIRAFPNHLHEHYVVGALNASRRALTMGGRELHVLEPGDVFLVNPGEPHACDPLDNEPFAYRCANVPVSAVAALAGVATEEAPRFAVPVLRDAALFGRADALFARAASDDGSAVLDALDELVSDLLEAADAAAADGPGEPSAPGALVASARAFIDERYAERIALEDVADVVGASRYALVRAFKKELGITPGRYLSAVRVMHAKSLLERGCAPAAVAGLTGFADQAHLGRVFRNVTGLTPARYRSACSAGEAS